MANKRISELEDLPVVDGSDLAVVVDIATLTTRKASMANLKSYFQSELPRPGRETVTITPLHLTLKAFTLTNAPSASYNVIILPQGGCSQFMNSDFIISGNSVLWEGYGLDGLLEVGDIVQVDYFY